MGPERVGVTSTAATRAPPQALGVKWVPRGDNCQPGGRKGGTLSNSLMNDCLISIKRSQKALALSLSKHCHDKGMLRERGRDGGAERGWELSRGQSGNLKKRKSVEVLSLFICRFLSFSWRGIICKYRRSRAAAGDKTRMTKYQLSATKYSKAVWLEYQHRQ